MTTHSGHDPLEFVCTAQTKGNSQGLRTAAKESRFFPEANRIDCPERQRMKAQKRGEQAFIEAKLKNSTLLGKAASPGLVDSW